MPAPAQPVQPSLDAQAYPRRVYQITQIRSLLLLVALFALVATPWFSAVSRSLRVFLGERTLLIPVLWGIVHGAMSVAVFVPDLVLRNIRRHYGLDRRGFGAWLRSLARLWVFQWLLGSLIYEVVYLFMDVDRTLWWLWSGLVLLGMHLMSQRQAALALLVSTKPKPLEDPVLLPRLEALRQRAGVPPCSFKVVKLSDRSREVVAAFTGLGKRRKVVMSDTMVDTLDANEIEAIVAHELGHCAHGDVPRRMGLNLLLGILAFLVVHLLSIMPRGPFASYRGLRDLAALPLIVLIVNLFSMVASIYVTRWHRKQELAADQFAFRVLPDLAPFISAMSRTMEQNLIGYSKEEQSKFTHPAMTERIAAAEAFQKERDRAAAAASGSR